MLQRTMHLFIPCFLGQLQLQIMSWTYCKLHNWSSTCVRDMHILLGSGSLPPSCVVGRLLVIVCVRVSAWSTSCIFYSVHSETHKHSLITGALKHHLCELKSGECSSAVLCLFPFSVLTRKEAAIILHLIAVCHTDRKGLWQHPIFSFFFPADNNVQRCKKQGAAALCFILSNECRLAASGNWSCCGRSYSEVVSLEHNIFFFFFKWREWTFVSPRTCRSIRTFHSFVRSVILWKYYWSVSSLALPFVRFNAPKRQLTCPRQPGLFVEAKEAAEWQLCETECVYLLCDARGLRKD